jgi:hypothetical protein
MIALVVCALVSPVAQAPKPKDPPAKAAEVAGFGLSAESEFHWPFYITKSPDVQKELKLSKEQLAAFDGAQADLKKSVAAMAGLTPAQTKAYAAKLTKWADETVAAILTAEQQKRHRQIVWQVLEFTGGVRGMAASPVFAKEVGLTADQQKQARKIEADYYAGWQKLVRANPLVGNGPVPGEEELAKKAEEAALKLLTAEQKKKWNEVLGEPFKGEIVQFTIPGLRPVTFKAPEKK